MDETEGFQCLIHSNWTICSLLSPFCSQIFPSISPSYWGAILFTPEGQLSEKGILPTPKLDETDRSQCLGHSNWTICSPFSSVCSETFPSFSLSWRLILITSEGQLSEKGILPTPKLDETEGFQCLGHSNWTICIPLNPFCSRNFPTFSFSYWEANSYYPRGPIMGKGNFPNHKSE